MGWILLAAFILGGLGLVLGLLEIVLYLWLGGLALFGAIWLLALVVGLFTRPAR